MIVDRFTWRTKRGCRDEVIKLVKVLVEELGLTPRVCTFRYGPYDMVISDLEFETMEDQVKFWAERGAIGPAYAEWREKRDDLTESGETHYLLQVH